MEDNKERRTLIIGNVCFIKDKQSGKILLLERSGILMNGKVTGVGGKTEYGEDIHSSCIREVKEETGYNVKNLKLCGVIKTINESHESSWILFVYITDDFTGTQIECPEGRLYWVDEKEIMNENLIGFIKEITPVILEGRFIEGTITHDKNGEVLSRMLKVTGID